MDIPSEFVVDRDKFASLRQECEKIIDTRKRLPDFVFRCSFAKYFAIEYAHIYGKSFGMFLRQLSQLFDDHSVNYMTADPEADYYFPRVSYFGLVSFTPGDLLERYVPLLSRERNIPKLLAGVNVGVFWGSSLRWGIHADRISWELMVIGVAENIDVPKISGFRCMDSAQVSSYVKSQYSIKDPSNAIASDFSKRFQTNYPV